MSKFVASLCLLMAMPAMAINATPAAADPVAQQSGQEPQYQRYKVARGDTFESVAKKFGLTAEQIKEANPRFTKYLIAGSIIQIPVTTQSATPAASSSTTTTAAPAAATSTTSATDEAIKEMELAKKKAEAEKAQAEAELARLQLEQARNNQNTYGERGGYSSRSSNTMDYRGFKMLTEVVPSYANKAFGLGVSLDLGAVVADGLFIGAGPQLSGSVYSGKYTFGGGVMSVIHYAIPTGSTIRPYVDGHWGWGFGSFKDIDQGGFAHNYSVGVQFANGTYLGVFGNPTGGEFTPGLKVGFGMPSTDGTTRHRHTVPTRDSGFELSVEGAFTGQFYSFEIEYLDETQDHYYSNPSGSITLGYRIDEHISAGIGISGGTYDREPPFIGGYLRGQYRFFDTRFTPLAEVDLGYDWNDLYNQGRTYITPRVGFAVRTTNNSYFTLKAGYLQPLSYHDYSRDKADGFTSYGLDARIGWTHVFSWLSR